jgi:hypothetical protein
MKGAPTHDGRARAPLVKFQLTKWDILFVRPTPVSRAIRDENDSAGGWNHSVALIVASHWTIAKEATEGENKCDRRATSCCLRYLKLPKHAESNDLYGDCLDARISLYMSIDSTITVEVVGFDE